jgi:hypothetical protein
LKLARNKTTQQVKSPPLKVLLEFAKNKGFYIKAGTKKEQVKNLLEKHIAAKTIQTAFRSKFKPKPKSVVQRKTPSPSPIRRQMAYAPVESMNSPSPRPASPKLSRENARNLLKTQLKRSNFTNVQLDTFRNQAMRYMKYSTDPSKHIKRLVKNMFG